MRDLLSRYKVAWLVGLLFVAALAAEWSADMYDYYRSAQLRSFVDPKKQQLQGVGNLDADISAMQTQLLLEDRKAQAKDKKVKETSWVSAPDQDDEFRIPTPGKPNVGSRSFGPTRTFSTFASSSF
jgi:hypothetical protein